VVVAAVVGVPLAFAGVAHAEGMPVSAASPPQYATTATFDIPYTASDDGGPGLDRVDLYVKGPTDLDWSAQPVATDTPDDTQSFSCTAGEGDGSYAFYTVAVDKTPISELPNLLGDGHTLVDTAAPASSASAPATTAGGPIAVTYTANDSGSGVGSVELWAKGANDPDYALAATDTTLDSPSFTYTPAAGDGTYSFYTIAVDKADKREAAPNAADATTVVQSPTQQPDAGTDGQTIAQLPATQNQQPALAIVAAVTLPGKQNLRVVLRKGLLVKLSAYRPVTLHLTLLLQPRTAKTVGLRKRVLVTRTVRAPEPDLYPIRLRLKKATAKRLRGLKTARFELRTVLATGAGTSKTSSRFMLTRR
jgi:hypothetical protein